MAGDYSLEDEVGTHTLQMGQTGDKMDGERLNDRAEPRAAMWGYCAFCGWKVGGMDTSRAVKRAYERHLAAAARKEAK